jgi:DNA polymerase III subunit alpha
MPHAPFVPLRIFSSYTMLEGAFEPKAIAKAAKAQGFPAATLCDRNGLYAAMSFSDACIDAGVQPIIGALVSVARPGGSGGGGDGPMIDWLPLIAQDDVGYANLCQLVSQAHLSPENGQEPHVTFDALAGQSDGLICLTGAADGALTRLLAEGQGDAANAYADALERLFPGRLYVELARRRDECEQAAEAGLIALAYARNLPLVATNPCCFADRDFHAAHDALLCIAQSAYIESAERRKSCPEAWLKPAEAMEDLFSDLPEALANTLVVAQRCGVRAPKRKPILPSVAGDREAEAAQLRVDARAGLVARLRKIANRSNPFVSSEVETPRAGFSTSLETNGVLDGVSTSLDTNGEGEGRSGDLDEAVLEAQFPEYFARLQFECDVIADMGFPGYFLIVADFIKWAKDQDIPVGPGRGSGAGSVVAWALTITDLDPLKLGLLFERFLNPERVSMPDFDIDFCETRRGEVIRYVQAKYGRDTVAQIITFGTMKARAVLKDTGRVLQMGYNQVDRLAKLVPNHPTDPWDLERALNGVSELAQMYKQEDGVRRLFDMARRLEGLPRHSSTHAAGVVIGDRPLAELVPLYRDPRSDMPVTQFDMKYVEGAGLVKFDFLGLKTLSVLKEAIGLLAKRGVSIDLDTLEWDDPDVYALLQRGETVGVFQLESEGMRRTLAAVKPTGFGDIIALVSLYRPGPMDNIPLFGRRKNGQEEIAYPHPLLEGILAETYGVFVYQEQVMQATQILAGYSLGGADLLRRAMGKKIAAEMAAQRETFVTGCATHNSIDRRKANELFDLIDKFAGYGFNKSHAAAYALLAYQTAWLKAHYPHEFYAASMSFELDNTDKLSIFVDDARRLEVAVAAPCINRSEASFSVEADGEALQIRYALSGLKGVGERAMEELVVERAANGAFASLDDFAERVDPRLLNRRQIEALAAAGAFDGIVDDRAAVFAGAEVLLATASSAADARNSGQGGLFGGDVMTMPSVQLPRVERWSMAEGMAHEKDAFGFYFSNHPVSRYRALTASLRARTYGEIAAGTPSPPGERRPVTMAVLVESAKARTSQRGNKYLMLTLSDRSGQFPASCFDEGASAALEALAASGGCALVQTECDWREGEETPRVAVRSVQSLDKLVTTTPLRLSLAVDGVAPLAGLQGLLGQARGGRSEAMLFVQPDAEAEPVAVVRLGRDFAIDQELVQRIERMAGVTHVALTLSGAQAQAA